MLRFGMDENQFQEHILSRLEKIDGHIMEIKIEIATLKVKSGVWGAVGAMIPIMIAFFVQKLS